MLDREAVQGKIQELIRPLLSAKRVDLVDLICRYEGGRIMVRCLVDTARGITAGELSHLNLAIGALLEEHDVISEPYLLEVSSPGLDRPLKTPLDFERVIGRRIKVYTQVPVGSRMEHNGELIAANDEAIMLRLDSGEKLQILLADVAKAMQEVDL